MTTSFTMYEGDTKTLEVTVRDAVGDVVNITGATIRWWMAKNVRATGADIYIEKSTGAGITIVDGVAGRFNVALDPADTEDMGTTNKTYYHEAETDIGGVISTVLVGQATILPALIE